MGQGIYGTEEIRTRRNKAMRQYLYLRVYCWLCFGIRLLDLVHYLGCKQNMNKLNTLLKCLPKSPFTDQLRVEINTLTRERNKYKASAKKFEWLLINSGKWSWQPSYYDDKLISGFASIGTGYLGYSFSDALKLAMKRKMK